MPDTRGKHGLFLSVTPGCKSSIVDTLHFEKSTIVNTPTPSVFMSIFSPCFFLAATFHARQQMNFHPCSVCSSLNNMVCGYGSSRLPLPQRPGSVVPRQRPPVCGGPRHQAVSSLGISRQLVVPVTRLSTVGDRAFPVVATRVWNSLPADVTSSPSLSTFKRRLKAELFVRSYP